MRSELIIALLLATTGSAAADPVAAIELQKPQSGVALCNLSFSGKPPRRIELDGLMEMALRSCVALDRCNHDVMVLVGSGDDGTLPGSTTFETIVWDKKSAAAMGIKHVGWNEGKEAHPLTGPILFRQSCRPPGKKG